MSLARLRESCALNEALSGLPHDSLICFIDDDIRVSPDVLEHYAAAADGIYGGVFLRGLFRVDYEQEPPRLPLNYCPTLLWGADPGVGCHAKRSSAARSAHNHAAS